MLLIETAVLITKLTVFSLTDKNIQYFIAIQVDAVWFFKIQLCITKGVGKIFATKEYFCKHNRKMKFSVSRTFCPVLALKMSQLCFTLYEALT